jgi:hypothetical protein
VVAIQELKRQIAADAFDSRRGPLESTKRLEVSLRSFIIDDTKTSLIISIGIESTLDLSCINLTCSGVGTLQAKVYATLRHLTLNNSTAAENFSVDAHYNCRRGSL